MATELISNYDSFIEAVGTFDQCTDDYLFFGEIKRDTINFSSQAAAKFGMPDVCFTNAAKVCSTFVHPDDYPELNKNISDIRTERITEFSQDCRWYDFMGNPVWVHIRAKTLKGQNGSPDLIVGTVAEIGQRRRADNITGFRDIAALTEKLENSFPDSGFIMRIFIRNMYELRVKHGTEAVERLQRFVSNAISDCLDEGQSCYYRTKGEYTVFSENGSVDDAFTLFKKISDMAADINAKLGYLYTFKLRAGVVSHTDYGDSVTELTKRCEFSSTFATSLNSKSFYTYDKNDYEEYKQSRELLSELQLSVKNGYEGFEVYYQPIFHAGDKTLYGCEELLRFKKRNGEFVSPPVFMPLLEESGLIIPVGRWALIKSIEQCKKWIKIKPDMRLNVNLSYIQLEREEVMREITDIILTSGLNAHNLALELTESGSLLKTVVMDYVQRFHDAGIKLALDDFGMGYSNLLYLNEMYVDVVKIDRSFVEACTSSKYSYSLIKHIAGMAHDANTKVCIEGIETKAELEKIETISPDFYQGFYFSRPIPPKEFEEKYINGHDQ
ncbi:MAG: EAL domain-containing protein [Firmicutes bacterium]|nr:EAL domain-containing protein [Bacillota bacterium]